MAFCGRLWWVIFVQFCSTINGQNEPRFSAILVFGDSVVDTGNNDYVPTPSKANHRPYGINFPGHVPTGRFSDGKLVPDLVASKLGIKETVPPFLQPNLSDHELLTGACFASASSGFDDQTASYNAIPLSKQPLFLADYLQRLTSFAGKDEAQRIVNEALVIIAAGSNDYLRYFGIGINKRIQFSPSEYADLLLISLQTFLKKLYNLGCRTMVVAGLPPIGCLPVTRTLYSPILRNCSEKMNLEAQSYNEKLENQLREVEEYLLGTKIIYADIYSPLMDMLLSNPKKYGFVETRRGCCGSGLLEQGRFCNGLSPVCRNSSQYLFWDSVHPTEAANRYLSEVLVKQINRISD